MIAKDAYGILVRHLNREDAYQLQASLSGEGLETEVVDESQLPQLPVRKWVRHIAVREEGLVVCDPCERKIVLPWEALWIVSAGLVQEVDFTRVSPVFSTHGAEMSGLRSTSIPSERQVSMWLSDLFIQGGSLRFSFRARDLYFMDAEQKSSPDPDLAFLELVRHISGRATQAALNRVSYSLREGHSDAITYPSRNAYNEELLWILWRFRKAGYGLR